MYDKFYGLSGLPFSLLPDSDFLFMSKRHRRAINLLEYGIMSRAGFIVITGEVGTGKTTIVRRFLKQANLDITLGVINNPSKVSNLLLNWIAMAFDFEDGSDNEAKTYDNFIKYLLAQYAKGKRTVLIIDEAQNLSAEALEQLRMLSNINNEKDQILQIVLVGQPELLEMLNRDELRQFAQRISVHCHLDALGPAETASYINHRLSVVGANQILFDEIACATVYFFTGGIPRLINLLCDQSLLYGYAESKQAIPADTVVEVATDRNKSGLSAFRVVAPKDYGTLNEKITVIANQTRSEKMN